MFTQLSTSTERLHSLDIVNCTLSHDRTYLAQATEHSVTKKIMTKLIELGLGKDGSSPYLKANGLGWVDSLARKARASICNRIPLQRLATLTQLEPRHLSQHQPPEQKHPDLSQPNPPELSGLNLSRLESIHVSADCMTTRFL